ncbi:MAG TPA: hypothetical protein VMT54_00185 [Candidatus Cybelea sp.]|nr:hypothetical protein [Candidatus Cybelea sp.]
MRIRNRPLVALGMVLAIRGCAVPYQSNARLLKYELVGEQTTMDPATGETIVTSTWKYEDGYTTTTQERLPRGNEQRRAERPPPRVVD